MAVYKQVYPRSQKNSYNPSDIIDFQLTFPDQSLLLNRIRVSGNLTVSGIPFATKKVYYDNLIGIHGFTNNWMVQSATRGLIENKSNYPRLVKMTRSAAHSVNDIYTSTRMTPDLVVQGETASSVMLVNSGITDGGNPAKVINNSISFSFLPQICLNNAISTDGSAPVLAYSQSNDITISFRLCSVLEALYGPDVSASVSYTISDLRLDYMTQPMVKMSPVQMMVITEVKQIVNSSTATIGVNLPVISNSMSCSFLKVANELSYGNNNTNLEAPKIERLNFQFNDSTSQYIFGLDNTEDIVENYLDSFSEHQITGKTDFTLRKLNDKDAYGVGLSFGDSLALANSNFALQLTASDVNADNQYYIYMYFRSFIGM